MSTKQRELKHNELADALGHTVDRYKDYVKPIVGTVVAIAVLLGLYQYSAVQSVTAQANAWSQYLEATGSSDTNTLKEVGNSNPTSAAGGWALVVLGDQKLGQALNDLTSNRAEVRNSLQDAKEAYDKVRKHTDLEIKQRAQLGYARTVEALGDLAAAKSEYEQVARQWPGTVFASMAEGRLKDIGRDSVRDFYDWLARKESETPKSDGPGIPGLRPGGLDSLQGNSNDINFSQTLDLNKPTTSGDTKSTDAKPAEGKAAETTDAAKAPEKK